MEPVQSREAYKARNAELDRRIRIYGYVLAAVGIIGVVAAFSSRIA
jgi:hypothetical protein